MSSMKRSLSPAAYLNESNHSTKRQKAVLFPTVSAIDGEALLDKGWMEVATAKAQIEAEWDDEATFQEAGRQAMIGVIMTELDKLYSDFDVLVRARTAIEEYARFTKEVIRDGCLQLGGADCLDHTPKPATLEEIVESLVDFPCPRNRNEGLGHLNDRVLDDFVSAINKGQYVLWRLKLSVDHAITTWSVWDWRAITKALQVAIPTDLLHISQEIDIRAAEQKAMIHELLSSSDPIIAAHRRFRSEVVESLQHKRSHSSEDYLLQKFDRTFYGKRKLKGKVKAAVQSLYKFRLGEVYTRSGLSTQLFWVEKFMEHKDFDVWRAVQSPPAVKYIGYKAVFRSFYKDLMSFPVIARQLAENVEKHQEEGIIVIPDD